MLLKHSAKCEKNPLGGRFRAPPLSFAAFSLLFEKKNLPHRRRWSNHVPNFGTTATSRNEPFLLTRLHWVILTILLLRYGTLWSVQSATMTAKSGKTLRERLSGDGKRPSWYNVAVNTYRACYRYRLQRRFILTFSFWNGGSRDTPWQAKDHGNRAAPARNGCTNVGSACYTYLSFLLEHHSNIIVTPRRLNHSYATFSSLAYLHVSEKQKLKSVYSYCSRYEVDSLLVDEFVRATARSSSPNKLCHQLEFVIT